MRNSFLRSKNNPIRAAFLFGFASLSSWMPVFNVWLEDEGFKGGQIGFIAAIPWGIMLVIQPVWGIIADRFGKVKCLIIALILATILFVFLPVFGTGIVAVSAMTLLVSVFNTPVLPLLDSIALDQNDISYSKIRFWGALGYGLGAVTTGWLIPVLGIDVAFYLSSIFLIGVLISLSKINSEVSKEKAIDIEFNDLNKVIINKLLITFLAIILVVSIGQSAITFYLTLYMKQIGAVPEVAGTAIGIQAFSELPFYFIAAWLLQYMKPNKIVLIAIAGTAIRLFLYSVNSNPNLVVLIEMMNGITWTLLWITSVEFINEMVPAKWRTTGQSLLWAAYFGAGAILGNVICGLMYQNMPMQQVYTIFSIVIFIVTIMAGIVFSLGSKREKIL